MTTRCHSVRSLRSPLWRSRHVSDVATDMFTMDLPSCMDLTSGSRPRLPTRMTLFTLPAIWGLLCFPGAGGTPAPTAQAANLDLLACELPPILGCIPKSAHGPPRGIHWSLEPGLRTFAGHERSVPCSPDHAWRGHGHAGRRRADDDPGHGVAAEPRPVPGAGLARAGHRHLRLHPRHLR